MDNFNIDYEINGKNLNIILNIEEYDDNTHDLIEYTQTKSIPLKDIRQLLNEDNMTKTEDKKTFIVPDGYAIDINLLRWNKKKKDFEILLIKRKAKNLENNKNVGAGEYALPGGFVKNNLTALEAAKEELQSKTSINLDLALFREGGVFDAPDRDPRGRIVTNTFFIFTNEDYSKDNYGKKNSDYEIKLVYLQDILNGKTNLFLDHTEIIKKHAQKIKYDIFSQSFNREFFGEKLFISILGENYNINEFYELAKWAGREENKTTFYRKLK